MGLPAEQNAAVKTGSGHEARAPVQRVPVSQEPGPGTSQLPSTLSTLLTPQVKSSSRLIGLVSARPTSPYYMMSGLHSA
jgi:hypothetical protein